MTATITVIEKALENSTLLTRLRNTSRQFARIARWLRSATSHSFLYRWLTDEPDPDVTVIDLRETYSVGPVLALIDRLVTSSAPAASAIDRAWRESTLYLMGDWVAGWIELTIESRAGQTIVNLLKPPEEEE